MNAISNPAELRRLGTEALIRDLGFVNAMRFLHQFESGTGDYTIERASLLPDWPTHKLLEEAEAASRRPVEAGPTEPASQPRNGTPGG